MVLSSVVGSLLLGIFLSVADFVDLLNVLEDEYVGVATSSGLETVVVSLNSVLVVFDPFELIAVVLVASSSAEML